MQIYRYSNQDAEKWPSGIESVQLVTSFAFYKKVDGKYDTSYIDDTALAKGLDVIESKGQITPLSLDIESFPWKKWKDNPGSFEFYEGESAKALRAYRERFPYRRLGIYGFMPVRSYWQPVTYIKTGTQKGQYDEWIELNRKFMNDEEGKGLTELVDVTMPSLYTFYDSMEDWKIYAEENVKVCREYQKPIMAWLWPLFHQGGKYKTADYEGANPPKPRPYIGDDYVRTQLHFLASLDIEAVIFLNSSGIPDSFYDVVKEFESGAPPTPPPATTTTTQAPGGTTTSPPKLTTTTQAPSGGPGTTPTTTTQGPPPVITSTTTTRAPKPTTTTTEAPDPGTDPGADPDPTPTTTEAPTTTTTEAPTTSTTTTRPPVVNTTTTTKSPLPPPTITSTTTGAPTTTTTKGPGPSITTYPPSSTTLPPVIKTTTTEAPDPGVEPSPRRRPVTGN